MSFRNKNIASRWFVLLFVGMSITFSTLHSHHDVEWSHSTNTIQSDQCITETSNVCPICGYLFNANIVDTPTRFVLTERPVAVSFRSTSQYLNPFSGEPAGRSPPIG
jgi:hypothetical protein